MSTKLLDLPAILKQAEAASEAPWEVDYEPQLNVVAECGDANNGQALFVYAYRLAPAEADAEFIAAARTNVPILVVALQEAQIALEAVREWRYWHGVGGYNRSDMDALDRILKEEA